MYIYTQHYKDTLQDLQINVTFTKEVNITKKTYHSIFI